MGRSRQPQITESLGERWGTAVAERRSHLQLSQSLLAELTGVTQQTISAIERGESIPLDGLKIKIALALRTTPAELFIWPEASHLRKALATGAVA